MKLHVLFEHHQDLSPFGCSQIRLLRPLSHPSNASAWSLSFDTEYNPNVDVVIVERSWKAAQSSLNLAEDLVRRARRDGVRLIYTLDDNLLDLEPRLITQSPYPPAHKDFIRYLARASDGVIVSTPSLGERMARLNPRVQVVPNQLDERLFAPPRAPREPGARLTLGYMGTFSHDADFMLILPALRAILQRQTPPVALELVGSVQDPQLLQSLAGLPVSLRNDGRPVQYPDFVRWMHAELHWDLALAPLEDTPFTRHKSDLKFLDYSALGIPGIYSRVPPYANTVRHLENGWLADNRVNDWRAALDTLLHDHARRRRLAQTAQAEVWNSRMLAQHAHEWRAAIAAILSKD